MKRLISLLVVLTMALSFAVSASAEGVQDALLAASTMSNEELYAKAERDAKRPHVNPDCVAGIPDSGVAHAIVLEGGK